MRRIVSAPHPSPTPQWELYETLTHELLQLLTAGESAEGDMLQVQARSIAFEEMEYTGAGLFVRLSVSPDSPVLNRNGVIGDVEVALPGGNEALGVLLFVAKGWMSALEVFAYADWPADITGFRCHYIRWRRVGEETRVAEATVARHPDSIWT